MQWARQEAWESASGSGEEAEFWCIEGGDDRAVYRWAVVRGGDGEEGVKMVTKCMYGLSSETRWGTLGDILPGGELLGVSFVHVDMYTGYHQTFIL